MDAGTITWIAAYASVLIALFILIRQRKRLAERMREAYSELIAEMREANSELRAEMREANSELRAEIRDLASRFGERISDVEREQARLDGANSVMKVQAHTHTSSTQIADD